MTEDQTLVGPPCLNPHADPPLRLRGMRHTPTPRQAYVLSTVCPELLHYGGGASGKSVALLAGALQFIDVPYYAALIVRNRFTDLAVPGGLIATSHQWLDQFAATTGYNGEPLATYNANEHRWTFSMSKATLTFAHIGDPDPHGDYRPGFLSGRYQFVGFDQADEIPDPLLYARTFARLHRPPHVPSERDGTRREGHGLRLSEVPLRARLTAGSLDPDDGLPGTAWVRQRFLESDDAPPSLRSTYRDLPFIDAEAYEEMLNMLPEAERRRLMGVS